MEEKIIIKEKTFIGIMQIGIAKVVGQGCFSFFRPEKGNRI